MSLLLLLLAFLPGFAWLMFFVKEEETHPEPKRFILLAFAAGIIAGAATVFLEKFFADTAARAGIGEFSLVALLVFALIEEFMKFAAAYLAIGRSRVARNPVDLMIYLIVAALGFATLENIGVLAGFLISGSVPGISFAASVAGSLSLRFVGATLLHALTSGIVGYHWAVGMLKRKFAHYVTTGIAIAAVLHLFFNLLILDYGNAAYAVVFLAFLGFFVLNDFEKLRTTTVEQKNA